MPKTPTVREDFAMVNAFVHGAAANSATINAALAAIGVLNRALVLPAADRGEAFTDWTIDADVTIPLNVTLSKGPGGTLNVLAGSIWTQNGPVWAGRYPIWDLTLGGTLVYNAPGFGFDEWTGNTGQILHWSTGLLTGEGNHVAPPGSIRSVTTPPATFEFKRDGFGNTGWVPASGSVHETVTVVSAAGQPQLTATFANANGAILRGVTTEIGAGFGTTTAISVGDSEPGGEARWADSVPTTASAQTGSANFAPGATPRVVGAGYQVIISAVAGGLFDGTGSIDVQLHYNTPLVHI